MVLLDGKGDLCNEERQSLYWKGSQFTSGTQNSWWRHQMETFSALLALCAGNSPVTGEFPPQRPLTRSFDVFFDLCLNKWLSKQSWGWWFETLSRSLWRHCNVVSTAPVDGTSAGIMMTNFFVGIAMSAFVQTFVNSFWPSGAIWQ